VIHFGSSIPEEAAVSGDKDLTDLFARAAAIAAKVPESMQEAAFLKAVDMLGGGSSESSGGSAAHPAKKATSRKAAAARATPPDSGPYQLLMDLDRAKAKEVDDQDGALRKSLALLLVAHRECGIDGLTSPMLAKVLTDRFRTRYTRQAITHAMDRAGRMVDARKVGGVTVWRLMSDGEALLAKPAEAKPTKATTPKRTRKRAVANTAKLVPAKKSAKAADPVHANSSSAPRGGRPGPKAALEGLIQRGYFATPRGISDLRTELDHNHANRYTAQDLSPALTRLLREQTLKRAKNASGQYEYTVGTA
jgi:hypothetical protein